jgi:hypothetical protein
VTAFAVAGLLGGLVLLVALSLYDQRAQARDWEGALEPGLQAALNDFDARFKGERELASLAYADADVSRAAGDVETAKTMLAAGYAYLEGLANQRRNGLRQMVRYSRMVSGIVPLPPLRPSQFQLAEIRGIAGGARLAHYLLVAAMERFRLRLWVLGHGFSFAVRALRPGSRRIAAARADYVVLDEETSHSGIALAEALARALATAKAPPRTTAEAGQ